MSLLKSPKEFGVIRLKLSLLFVRNHFALPWTSERFPGNGMQTLDKEADTEDEDAYPEKWKAGSDESSGGLYLYIICCLNHCYQDTNHGEARIPSVV